MSDPDDAAKARHAFVLAKAVADSARSAATAARKAGHEFNPASLSLLVAADCADQAVLFLAPGNGGDAIPAEAPSPRRSPALAEQGLGPASPLATEWPPPEPEDASHRGQRSSGALAHMQQVPRLPPVVSAGEWLLPEEAIKWVELPGGQCQGRALCVAYNYPDLTSTYSHAHDELVYLAPAFKWALDSERAHADYWERWERIEPVHLAFSAGTWAKADVAEGWVFLEKEGIYVRAYGVGFQGKRRVQAMKAALAVAVHMHMALSNDGLAPLYWLSPLEDQCKHALAMCFNGRVLSSEKKCFPPHTHTHTYTQTHT